MEGFDVADWAAYAISVDKSQLEDFPFWFGTAGQYMFYYCSYNTTGGGSVATSERTNGAIPLASYALDVDLPNINFSCPELIFRYQMDSDSLVSRKCGVHSFPGNMQRDWNGSMWYAAVNDGTDKSSIYASQNNGNSWSLDSEFDCLITCVMPDTHSVLYEYIYAAGNDQFHRRRGGLSWDTPVTITDADIRAIDIHPVDEDYILIADNGGGVWMSDDLGSSGSWSQINSGLTNLDAYCVKYCPRKSNIAVVGTAGGLFKTTTINTSPTSWYSVDPTAATDTVTAVDFNPDLNQIVFLALKDDGVGSMYVSVDTAENWIPINSGLNGNLIYDIAFDVDRPDTVFIATEDGIYQWFIPVHCGEITSNETWGPGLVIVNGDVTVDAGDTLTIEDSTTVLFAYDFDLEQGGSSSSKSELIIEGALIANGTSSDSILFVSSREPMDSASVADWYGIHFKAGSTGDMDHCAIRDAVIGIEIDSAEVELAHCLIKDNQTKGIDSYKGELTADSCDFEYNISYAIYCDENHSGSDSIKITHCNIDNGGSIPGLSQYAVLIDNADRSRISDCVIREYSQGGVKLIGSDTDLFDNKIRKHTTQGIYAINSAHPTVRRCVIDSVSIGVKAITQGKPDIGVSPDSGKCSFLNCSNYFIYFDNSFSLGADTLWAEYNWYGSSSPSSMKFYTDAPQRVIKWSPYLTSAPKLQVDRRTPVSISLNQNYPNPFNPTTSISFTLEQGAPTVIIVYNLLGQQVVKLLDQALPAGQHSVEWDGRNDVGVSVGSGVYFYTIQSGSVFESRKMLLLR